MRHMLWKWKTGMFFFDFLTPQSCGLTGTAAMSQEIVTPIHRARFVSQP